MARADELAALIAIRDDLTTKIANYTTALNNYKTNLDTAQINLTARINQLTNAYENYASGLHLLTDAVSRLAQINQAIVERSTFD